MSHTADDDQDFQRCVFESLRTIHQQNTQTDAAFLVIMKGKFPIAYHKSDARGYSKAIENQFWMHPCCYGPSLLETIQKALTVFCYPFLSDFKGFEVFIQPVIPSENGMHGMYPNWSGSYKPEDLIFDKKLRSAYRAIVHKLYDNNVHSWNPLYAELVNEPALLQAFSTGFEKMVPKFTREGWVDANKISDVTATFVLKDEKDRNLVMNLTDKILNFNKK